MDGEGASREKNGQKIVQIICGTEKWEQSSRRRCLKNKHDENELAKLKFQFKCSEQHEKTKQKKQMTTNE